ncbi:F0F1 ATP synthase subunit A [Brevibacterium sp. CS2]|uniref:F0F1 ATP synthase subunit A n=1 Tax=Brevibacterium sp. CS2 TaxID=2575923 RepID=UPI0010C789D4|nr:MULTISPECIES: F0F1 ATP synthase subunit A [Actinomycetes]MCX0276303.1 F0F1 ATP synthase subunit A [Nocardia zapadnayensis]QCP05473.1 F0F1 ATP synthase subunit A [Brevibacterium sp. CS2]
MLLAASEGGGFHAPGLEEFYPPAVLFAGTPFELNRIMIIRIIVSLLLVLLFVWLLRNPKLVPGRGQSIAEMVLDFIRKGIAYDMLGKKDGDRFFPLIAVIFLSVFALNITGIIPFLNISSNANIGMPLVMALVAYVVMIGAGIKAQGGGQYIKSQLFPAGVPKAMYILVTPIEAVSTFVARPLSLTLRLTFNMLVGHLLLVLCFAATQYFIVELGGAWAAFGALTFIGGFAFTLFEILVAILQAYIFALLTAAYIQLSVSQDH